MTTTATRKPRARATDTEALAAFETGAGFTDVDPVRMAHLRAMIRAREAVERAQTDLDETVRMSRATGSTLAECSIALAITPQAVSKRYPRAG